MIYQNKIIQSVINEETILESEFDGYSIYIPRAYARGESNEWIRKPNEIQSLDHYELRITRQIGSVQTRKDSFVYIKLPKSDTSAAITLHTDGGISFHPSTKRLVYREYDQLDRRIILGFCRKFQSMLFSACHDDEQRHRNWLEYQASRYRFSDQPKRFKQGSEGNDFSRFYKDLKPYELLAKESSNIFMNIRFI